MTWTVRQLLKHKKNNMVWTIRPDALVFDAVKLMADKNVGALVVMLDERIEGIVTERDYSRKVVLLNRSCQNTRVADIMSKRVLYLTPEDKVKDAMALMTEKRIRHLPVLEYGRMPNHFEM